MLIGSETVDGVFTPGELLKIALAACSGMSSDQPLARRLGEDYLVRIEVSGPADREQERYPVLDEKMVIDLSGLTPEERQRVLTVVERAVDQVCTVGRTLKAGAEVNFSIEP
ncbi:OsmC family protein [Mycobacteroides abscessus subsp. massiliense]|nr:OsmC family protein [Mycobacteroides abscessus subsp. massiliense]